MQAQETLTFPRQWIVESTPEALSLEEKDLTLAVRYTEVKSAADADAPGFELSKTLLIDSRQFDTKSYLELRKILEANPNSRRSQVILALPQ